MRKYLNSGNLTFILLVILFVACVLVAFLVGLELGRWESRETINLILDNLVSHSFEEILGNE